MMGSVDKRSLITFGILLAFYTAGTQALQCYFCGGTGEHSACENYDNYEAAASCEAEAFRKNCTEGFDDMCTIESHRINGANIVQLRGCNDGKSFYFTSPNRTLVNLDSLKNLKADKNETRCAYDGQYMICVTKCDSDFCNGPQLDMKPCGGMAKQSSKFVLISLVSFVLFLKYS